MFYTFEGPDGAGKSTQAELLKNNLESQGHKVKLIHFPRYESPIGKLIGSILSSGVEVNFESMQMLYVADQLDFQDELNSLLSNGYHVIADRYDISTIAYYMSKRDLTVVAALNLIYNKWQTLLRIPDFTFILSIENHIEDRIGNDNLDLFESDKAITSSINDNYKTISHFVTDREFAILDAKENIDDLSKLILSIIK